MSVPRVLTSVQSLLLRPITGEVTRTAPPNPGVPDLQMPLQPLPPGMSNKSYDGLLIGGDNLCYPAGTPWEAVPPMLPRQGVENDEVFLHINGIAEGQATAAAKLRELADATGSKVIGIYNASEGPFKDVIQVLQDRADKGKNPAVDTAAELIHAHAQPGAPGLSLSGHSQGALIASRAFQDVRNRLTLEDGFSRSEADQALGKFKLLTVAGAASHYDDSVRTQHLVNHGDVVQLVSFYTFGNNPPNPLVHQGDNSRTRFFTTLNPITAHDMSLNLRELPGDWLGYLNGRDARSR